jgi:hypothetical protein
VASTAALPRVLVYSTRGSPSQPIYSPSYIDATPSDTSTHSTPSFRKACSSTASGTTQCNAPAAAAGPLPATTSCWAKVGP